MMKIMFFEAVEGRLGFLDTEDLGTLLLYGLEHLRLNRKIEAIDFYEKFSNLSSTKEFDPIFTGIMLGLNDFSNIWRLDDFEKSKILPCLEHVSSLWEEEQNNNSFNQAYLVPTTSNTYTRPSPCLDLQNHQPCREYCELNNLTLKTLNKQQLLTIMR